MDTSARIGRRGLLAGFAGVAGLAGCTDGPEAAPEEEARVSESTTPAPDPRRISYGQGPSQWAELTRPAEGRARGTVVVLHGGFWRAAYGAELGEPLAADLVGRGWATLNVEYRRVGGGGGYPATLDDVAAAIDLLADEGLDGGPVVTLGHSAGGQLAAWAAARARFDRWHGGVGVSHVVTQAGVLDLASAARSGIGRGAAEAFMGATPEAAPTAYARADPAQQVPLDRPLWAVHARDDDTVPFSHSADYVERARAAGADARLVEVGGGHFGHIDTGHPAWSAAVELLDRIG